MPRVTFYALADGTDNPQQDLMEAAATLALDTYQARKWMLIHCQTQEQAVALDEFIWQFPADRFIPHNLIGEGPQQGTPVEIAWQGQTLKSCHTALNLTESMLDEYKQYQHIIDFVPVDEQAKQAARDRYKQYKQAGCAMHFQPLATLYESN